MAERKLDRTLKDGRGFGKGEEKDGKEEEWERKDRRIGGRNADGE